MAYQAPKDYVEVRHRVIEFREKHPDGSLQADPVEWIRDDQNRIIGLTIRAKAYRTPDDPRPGVGTAFEFYPGKTPYTKGSEVQNAETSAWGRALIAVGAADATHGIASADEVRRSGSSGAGTNSSPPTARTAPSNGVDKARADAIAALKANDVDGDAVKKFIREELGFTGLSQVDNVDDFGKIIAWAGLWAK